jgi:hypothetical protein
MLFIETSVFTKQADDILGDDELAKAQELLRRDPYRGVLIRGSGGLRKIRVASSGSGKRGGARIIYFLCERLDTCYLLLVYGKNTRDNLSHRQILQLRSYVDENLRNETDTFPKPPRQH